ncbi:MAG TPA: ABC transporter ATP-binding protein [Desulfosporosinus sp.]|nr:ABC transporter ATP-binding protein [Desulfosporosinus sp.]
MKKIVFDDVSKIYGDDESSAIVALDGASLEIEQGEFIGIIGPSGSGKSTFLSLAGALIKPTKGKVLINGKDISTLPEKELTKVRLNEIGFILQTSNLIPYLNAVDQLILVKDMKGKISIEDREKAIGLLKDFGLGARLNHYPNSLSGGERQRIAVARAFMNDPEIILADEPTASLDTKRGYELMDLLAKQAKQHNKAVILVTHDERMLSHCQRIIVMTDGKLIER